MADRKEVNEVPEIDFELKRMHESDIHRVLRCKNCGNEELRISLLDNEQWDTECLNCFDSAEILSNLINTLR